MSEITWDGKGLPPVGAKVKINIGASHYEIFSKIDGKDAEIICHTNAYESDDVVAVFRCAFGDECVYHGLVEGNFKPIKSERDKAIEDMASVLEFVPDSLIVSILSRIYDAGLYKKAEK